MPTSLKVLTAALLVLVACSDPPNAASVRVTPETAVVPLGTSLQLDAVALDCCGNPIVDAQFTWSSSNPSAISVSEAGLITTVSHGSAIITVGVDGVSANVDAAVAPEFSQISANSMTCGLSPTGAPSCWGHAPPEPVPGGLTFTQVTAGGGQITGGWCWGSGDYGALGNGTSGSAEPAPAQISGSLVLSSISAGA